MREQLSRNNLPVPEPELPAVGEDLLGFLSDLGWGMLTEAGLTPLSYTEVAHYSSLVGETLSPWEVIMIRRLSEAYCIGVRDDTAVYQGMLIKVALVSASFMERRDNA